MNRIPQITEVGKSIESDLEDIQEASGFIDEMSVETKDDLSMAVQMTAIIKESQKKIDEKRQTWTGPLNKVIDDINETFATPLKTLKDAEQKLKTKINECVKANEDTRNKLLSQVETAQDGDIPDLLAKADTHIIDKVPGLSIRESISGKVEDESAIIKYAIDSGMLQLLSVNKSALNVVTKQLKEKTNIPGWNVSKKRTVAITASKVKQ